MQETKETNTALEFLHDVKKNGKELLWDVFKKSSALLGGSYERLSMDNKAARVRVCATALSFLPKEGGGMKLVGGHFCRIPLCPMCAMRRSRKIFGQVSKIMNYMEREEKYRYIFLTFTVKNVSGRDLSKTLDELMAGFHLLVHYVLFKKLSKGWFRALEITHNWKRDDYHPHLHMVIAVDEKYFNRKENYLTHEKWRREWQKCMGLDYEPGVRVQRVVKEKSRNGEISSAGAVAEIAKYTAKNMDYLVSWKDRKRFEEDKKVKLYSKAQCESMTDGAVAVLDEAIHKRRLVAFGGRMKEVHKLLNLDDPENGDLINTNNEDEEMRKDLEDVILHYKWNIGVGRYVLVKNENANGL